MYTPLHDLGEVVFSDPSDPVALQDTERGVAVPELAKRPLVDDGGITGVVKYVGSDPGLCAVCVNTAAKDSRPSITGVLTSSTSHPPRLTPRAFSIS